MRFPFMYPVRLVVHSSSIAFTVWHNTLLITSLMSCCVYLMHVHTCITWTFPMCITRNPLCSVSALCLQVLRHGYETIAGTLSWMFYALYRHPKVPKKHSLSSPLLSSPLLSSPLLPSTPVFSPLILLHQFHMLLWLAWLRVGGECVIHCNVGCDVWACRVLLFYSASKRAVSWSVQYHL